MSDELARIRDRIERSHALTINPGETTESLVRRLAYLAMPETAGMVWFDRWQVERQCTRALRVALASVLTRLDNGETVDRDLIDEAWAVLRDVTHLMPAVADPTEEEEQQ